ncbi:MAG TPA: helix-turn-helix transcriptional regulator [Chryseosolibacter sp.]
MKSTKSFNRVLTVVGMRLAELREKKGYSTLKEFAEVYDLPQIQYWRMEKGKANITLKSLARILKVHNMTLQEFFCMITEGQEAI